MRVVKAVILLLVVLSCAYFSLYWQVGGNTDTTLSIASGVVGQRDMIAQSELIEKCKSWSWFVPLILAMWFYLPGIIRKISHEVSHEVFNSKMGISCCKDMKGESK